MEFFSRLLHRAMFLGLFWSMAMLQVALGQSDTLRLLFVGDVMGHTPQIQSAERVKNKEYDYNPCFTYVKPLIERADLAIGNLELTLPGKPPYTGYPMFRSPDALALALKNAGFDVLVTANNHANDSRAAGVRSTLQTVRDLGFMQTGTFKDAQDRASNYPLIIHKKGFKLALLNYTFSTNGIPVEAPTIVNMIDTLQIKADLREARARKPHFIIVIMHWGVEYQLQENAEQRRLAKMMIQNGADMIIGAHPHVVQPIKYEQVKMPDGGVRQAVVVYSLGNFISNQKQPNTEGGIMYQVDLVKNKGASATWVGKNGYIPVFRYIHKPDGGKPVYQVVPVAQTERNPGLVRNMSETGKLGMNKFAVNLRKRMQYPELKY